jgi:excisionase family DNA binding protein
MAVTVPSSNRLMTSDREARLAGDVLASLEGPHNTLVVDRAGDAGLPVPPEVGRILQEILRVMAQGGTVTVSTLPSQLTTTAAAAVLGVSRPTLMTMIKDGRLTGHKVGSHTRLRTDDVLAERTRRRERERAAFAELREIED